MNNKHRIEINSHDWPTRIRKYLFFLCAVLVFGALGLGQMFRTIDFWFAIRLIERTLNILSSPHQHLRQLRPHS